MPDYSNASPQPAAQPEPPHGAPATLRCQWCASDLLPSVTVCPTCGSVGAPTTQVTAVESTLDTVAQPTEQTPLTEWWREDSPDGYDGGVVRRQLSFEEAERRKMQTYCVIGASVAFCMLTGWLSGPLLSGTVEHFTGTTIENGSDLRPMGAIIGLMVGFFIGSTGGWIVWSSKS